MEYSRVALLSLLIVVLVTSSLAATDNCGVNEVSNKDGSVMTCNACRDSGPCLCKQGFIRRGLDQECISEAACHKLHLEWMHAAKYQNKKNKFFNCK